MKVPPPGVCQAVHAAQRCLTLFDAGFDLMRRDDINGLHLLVENALAELVAFRLLTILRLEGSKLYRIHTSDLVSYPTGGSKDIAQDQWLSSMLHGGVPVISDNAEQVRERFFDHEAIFTLDCESVMNVPVVGVHGTMGSVNLLHHAGWFTQEHALFVRPFVSLLATAWARSLRGRSVTSGG